MSDTLVLEFDGKMEIPMFRDVEKLSHKHRSSKILKRLAMLPPELAYNVIDDVSEALEIRISTMEHILNAKKNS